MPGEDKQRAPPSGKAEAKEETIATEAGEASKPGELDNARLRAYVDAELERD